MVKTVFSSKAVDFRPKIGKSGRETVVLENEIGRKNMDAEFKRKILELIEYSRHKTSINPKS